MQWDELFFTSRHRFDRYSHNFSFLLSIDYFKINLVLYSIMISTSKTKRDRIDCLIRINFFRVFCLKSLIHTLLLVNRLIFKLTSKKEQKNLASMGKHCLIKIKNYYYGFSVWTRKWVWNQEGFYPEAWGVLPFHHSEHALGRRDQRQSRWSGYP